MKELKTQNKKCDFCGNKNSKIVYAMSIKGFSVLDNLDEYKFNEITLMCEECFNEIIEEHGLDERYFENDVTLKNGELVYKDEVENEEYETYETCSFCGCNHSPIYDEWEENGVQVKICQNCEEEQCFMTDMELNGITDRDEIKRLFKEKYGRELLNH